MSKPAVQTWPPPTHLVPSPWLCWGNKDCLCLGFYLFFQNQDMCSTTIFPPNKNPNVLLQVYRAHQLHQDRSPILVTWLNQVRAILLPSLAARFSERKLLPLSGFGLLGQTPSSLFSSSCSSLSSCLFVLSSREYTWLPVTSRHRPQSASIGRWGQGFLFGKQPVSRWRHKSLFGK